MKRRKCLLLMDKDVSSVHDLILDMKAISVGVSVWDVGKQFYYVGWIVCPTYRIN